MVYTIAAKDKKKPPSVSSKRLHDLSSSEEQSSVESETISSFEEHSTVEVDIKHKEENRYIEALGSERPDQLTSPPAMDRVKSFGSVPAYTPGLPEPKMIVEKKLIPQRNPPIFFNQVRQDYDNGPVIRGPLWQCCAADSEDNYVVYSKKYVDDSAIDHHAV